MTVTVGRGTGSAVRARAVEDPEDPGDLLAQLRGALLDGIEARGIGGAADLALLIHAGLDAGRPGHAEREPQRGGAGPERAADRRPRPAADRRDDGGKIGAGLGVDGHRGDLLVDALCPLGRRQRVGLLEPDLRFERHALDVGDALLQAVKLANRRRLVAELVERVVDVRPRARHLARVVDVARRRRVVATAAEAARGGSLAMSAPARSSCA